MKRQTLVDEPILACRAVERSAVDPRISVDRTETALLLTPSGASEGVWVGRALPGEDLTAAVR